MTYWNEMGLSVNFVHTYIPIAMTENQQAIVVPKTFVTCHMEIHINKLGMNTSTGSSHFRWFCFNATWIFIYAIIFGLT